MTFITRILRWLVVTFLGHFALPPEFLDDLETEDSFTRRRK